MSFDEKLADKIRHQLKGKRGVEEKKMFGGLCFMINSHMCCGVESDRLVVRVGPENYEAALTRKYTQPMDFTGRPLKGFVYVARNGFRTKRALEEWVELGLTYVKTLPAKSSKKRGNLGLNLGPKTTSEMASIGVGTLADLRSEGWEQAFRRLVKKFPERRNMNMASALIGAELGVHWQKIPKDLCERTKQLIKSLKPAKATQRSRAASRLDASFVDFVVHDQLSTMEVEARRMFGGFGLYSNGKFFGLIHTGCLYLKTNQKTRAKYRAEGMGPFSPNPRQTLKSYFQVPVDPLEDAELLQQWAQEALALK